MSEVSFGAGATPVETSAPETATETQAPQSQSTAVARPLGGDYVPCFRDIILPSVQIAHPVGDIGKTHPHGSIVFNNRVRLYVPPEIDVAAGKIIRPATPPAVVTFLGFETPQFVEKVAGGARGLALKTEQAVTAAGGTLDYNEWQLKKASGMKYFNTSSRALVAIERPESAPDDDTVFVHEVNGKKYTLGFWTFKAGAYTAVCKRVVFAAKLSGCLQKGYPSFSFQLSTKLNSFDGGNSAWMPVAVPCKASTPEFLAFVKEVLQG
jgi:hypothetical protein